MKHDAVSNYIKITFWWLFLVFNISNNFFKKSNAKFGKYINLVKKKKKNEYLAKQLDFPKNSSSNKSSKTSLF